MSSRRSEKKNASSLLDSAKNGGKKGSSANAGRVVTFLAILGLLGIAVVLVSSKNGGANVPGNALQSMAVSTTNTKPKKQSGPMADIPDFTPAFTKYDKCVVKWTPPPPRKEWNTKPLWLTSFPGSGSSSPAGQGDIMKPLINGITGLPAGAKFYHASSKILRRCHGIDETATCSNGHPQVDIGPEKQKANFYHSAIMVIRNIRTAFPVFHNDKAIAYHGLKGQMPENEWRQARDTWYSGVLTGWKGVLTTWKAMKAYDIGMYLQYEELMDPLRGPDATQRLANLLQSAGFTVAPKEDLPCIWFQAIKGEYLRLKEFRQYEYGYTLQQRDAIVKQLEEFQKEIVNDKPLANIVQEYIDDVRDNTRIDVPFQEDGSSGNAA
ncbi:expressed unknown protein [Seminavis robusta]|uniref:Uncharacterized protein n=1 Tax=Seminavis robusta TaxID=568900 RepID=A0A9N8DD54_9STRA|nr:expressed unknown protein [Seminavis robusta]|eukprot:Sro84_g044920.1 n/a (380) ;mRNA; r:78689-79828